MINWTELVQSANYYGTIGYTMVDVPWVVSRKIAMATCPSEDFLVTSNLGELVGSAEQGFLQLDHDGLLGEGKFMAISPCFRVEEVLDDLHQNYFAKLELYVNEGELFGAMEKMAESARTSARGQFHRMSMAQGVILPVPILEETDAGFDLTAGGIELGSFGVRTFEDVSWAFGTGHAEPRMSSTINKFVDQVRQKGR